MCTQSNDACTSWLVVVRSSHDGAMRNLVPRARAHAHRQALTRLAESAWQGAARAVA